VTPDPPPIEPVGATSPPGKQPPDNDSNGQNPTNQVHFNGARPPSSDANGDIPHPSPTGPAKLGPLPTEKPPSRQARNLLANDETTRRDHEPKALTPIDQSNDTRDLEITQAIRKTVFADDRLSFNAKNVKVITIDGKVTLRGPVDSVQERASIAAIAKQTAGVVAVDDQLEVNPMTSRGSHEQ
jgi:hypothetical protein